MLGAMRPPAPWPPPGRGILASPAQKPSSPPPRHGRFKRSNSVTAAVQADLEPEGFPGRVATEDKGLQFGSSFQRHSEPSTPTQGGAVRTVRTQGLFSYREDYRPAADAASLPAPEPWLGPALDSPESGRAPPSRRDGPWFLELLRAETARMESWCKDMEREAEEHDLAEDGEPRPRAPGGGAWPACPSRARGEGRAGAAGQPPAPERPGPRLCRAQAPRTGSPHLAAAGSGVWTAPRNWCGPAPVAFALALCQGDVAGQCTVLPLSRAASWPPPPRAARAPVRPWPEPFAAQACHPCVRRGRYPPPTFHPRRLRAPADTEQRLRPLPRVPGRVCA